ncbi:MAG: transposase [Endomicrobium sp.]|nr:transposase [Endomicrobium sp.]
MRLHRHWNYPRCLKSNAFIECFCRTVKEQFVYRNEDCSANKKIKRWLFWYNMQRGHKSLNYETPLHYLQLLHNFLKHALCCDVLQTFDINTRLRYNCQVKEIINWSLEFMRSLL